MDKIAQLMEDIQCMKFDLTQNGEVPNPAETCVKLLELLSKVLLELQTFKTQQQQANRRFAGATDGLTKIGMIE